MDVMYGCKFGNFHLYKHSSSKSHMFTHNISLQKWHHFLKSREVFSWFPKEWKRPVSQKNPSYSLKQQNIHPQLHHFCLFKKNLWKFETKKRPPKTWVGSLNLVFSRAFQPSRTLKLVGIVRFWPPSWFWKIPVNTAQLFPGWGEAWLALVYCFFCPWNTSLFRSSQQWG